jgi:hypothetical protein
MLARWPTDLCFVGIHTLQRKVTYCKLCNISAQFCEKRTWYVIMSFVPCICGRSAVADSNTYQKVEENGIPLGTTRFKWGSNISVMGTSAYIGMLIGCARGEGELLFYFHLFSGKGHLGLPKVSRSE